MSRRRRRWGLVLAGLLAPAAIGSILVQPVANAGHCTTSVGPVSYGVTTSPPDYCVAVTTGVVDVGHGVTTKPGFAGAYVYECVGNVCDFTGATVDHSTDPSGGAGVTHYDCTLTFCVVEATGAGVDRTSNGGFVVSAGVAVCYFDSVQSICPVNQGVSQRIEK